jgi:uncharacterized protein
MSAAEPRRAGAWFAPAGALIGAAGALCGIGGGIFAVPLLHRTAGLPLRRATATALPLVLATTSASSAVELLRADAQIHVAVVIPLALGALAGSELGFRIARRMPDRALHGLFTLVLLAAGLRVLLFSRAIGGGAQVGALATAIISAATGIAGGVLTPLLGVGGGLVMVPALFLTLGQLGFGGARACSLAAGAVAAVRSLWLHARAGNVAWAPGLPLALGALLGAASGVLLTRMEGFAQAGRIGLGLILVAQSLIFAGQFRRASERSRPPA